MAKKFYFEQDTQCEYREGEESYHVFEAGRLNEFGERYCVAPFVSYAEAQRMVNDLNRPPCELRHLAAAINIELDTMHVDASVEPTPADEIRVSINGTNVASIGFRGPDLTCYYHSDLYARQYIDLVEHATRAAYSRIKKGNDDGLYRSAGARDTDRNAR